MSENARIHQGLLRLWLWQSDALITRLDLVPCGTLLDLIPTRLDLILNSARSHPQTARSHPQTARLNSHSVRSHPLLGYIASSTRLDLILKLLDLIPNPIDLILLILNLARRHFASSPKKSCSLRVRFLLRIVNNIAFKCVESQQTISNILREIFCKR